MMTSRKNLIIIEGFVIQKRDYRNNSFILTVFTKSGKVLRGILNKANKYCLNLYKAYSWKIYLRQGLSLITEVEITSTQYAITGTNNFCGLYINELIGRLYDGFEDAELIYKAYISVLSELSSIHQQQELEKKLRLFELQLFNHLGYGIDFNYDQQGNKICAESQYIFTPGEGFIYYNTGKSFEQNLLTFNGADLLIIGANMVNEKTILTLLKKINRSMINYLLQGKPLISRKFFEYKQTSQK